MSSQIWAEHFGISDQQVTAWQNEAGGAANDQLLQWCLLNGKIPRESYFSWAVNKYNLPILKPEFFSRTPEPEFCEAAQALTESFQWQKDFVPVAFWQDILYIACLTPRQNLPQEITCCLVLADPSHLVDWHSKLIASNETAAEKISSGRFTGGDTEGGADLGEATKIDLAYVAPATLNVAPATLSDSPPPILQPSSVLKPEPSQVIGEATQTRSVVTSVTGKFEATAARIEFEASASLVEDLKSNPTPSTDAPQPMITQGLWSPSPGQNQGYVPPQAPAPVPTAYDSSVRRPGQRVPSLALPQPFIKRSQSAVVAHGTPVGDIRAAKTFEDIASISVASLLSTFEASVFFVFADEKPLPYKWTELLQSVKGETPEAINIKEPSIFRIAVRTCLPYHGYVRPSSVNLAFYNQFNRGIAPNHVTLIPILYNNHLIAMLMGLSNQEVSATVYKESLGKTQTIADAAASQIEALLEKFEKSSAA